MTLMPRYQLRPRTERLLIGDAVLLRLGKRKLKIPRFGAPERAVLTHFLEGGSLEALQQRLRAEFDDDQRQRAERIAAALLAEDLLETETFAHDAPPADVKRFQRLLELFSQCETPDLSRYQMLSRLRTSSVVVVGLGGLGSWVVYQLLCFAVGRLTLVDPDVVEASNLNRSILFTERDIGRLKTVVANEAIARFAPRTDVVTVNERIEDACALTDIARGASLLIGTADRPHWRIRQWVAEACRDAGVPGLQSGGGRVGPFHIPGVSSCMMCYLAAQVRANPRLAAVLYQQDALPRRATGSLSSFGGMVAAVIGHEAFRYLSGLSQPLTLNRAWQLHAPDLTAGYVDVPVAPDCRVCAGQPAHRDRGRR